MKQLNPVLRLLAALLFLGCNGVVDRMPGEKAQTDAGQNGRDASVVIEGPGEGSDGGNASDGGNGFDAVRVDAGAALVPVFMAQGHLGRTVMSCDDGRTWVNDRSDSDAGHCWREPNQIECDHTPISGVGLDTGGGTFFANFGWGYNGSLRRSTDGKNWEVVKDGAWGGGVSYSDGVVLWLAGGDWPVSMDKGATWGGSSQAIPGGYFASRVLSRAGTKIVVSGDDPAAGLFSNNSGRTWASVDLSDAGTVWQRSVQLAEGNGVLVTVSSRLDSAFTLTTYAATSTDGLTWRGKEIYQGSDQNYGWNGIFFTGAEFVSFSNGNKMVSAGGMTWSGTPISNSGAVHGPLARAQNGTWVSIPNNWDQYYERQKAFRSTDGINWEQIATWPGGHPITRLVSGYLPASACP